VEFFGHTISHKGVLPSKNNVKKKILNPENVTRVRAVLVMASYYRRHIKDYSGMMQPLIKLTKKTRKFLWTSECENSLQMLKQALTSPQIMAYPTDDGKFIPDCDFCIGAVLSQKKYGIEKVFRYGSKMLKKRKRTIV
jgi:hypothetical protein